MRQLRIAVHCLHFELVSTKKPAPHNPQVLLVKETKWFAKVHEVHVVAVPEQLPQFVLQTSHFEFAFKKYWPCVQAVHELLAR